MKDALINQFTLAEYSRAIITQLSDLNQKRKTLLEYNERFSQLTMQILKLPQDVQMTFYLKGLDKDLRRTIESNQDNLKDIETVQFAALRQDQIDNPSQRIRTRSDSALTSTTTPRIFRYQPSGRGYERGRARGTFRGNFGCGYQGFQRGRGRGRQHIPVRDQSKITCYICNETGHISRFCPLVKDLLIQRERRMKEKIEEVKRMKLEQVLPVHMLLFHSQQMITIRILSLSLIPEAPNI